MTDERKIWDYLMAEYKNANGVAALMGNLYVESRLDPSYAESSKIKKIGLTKNEYVRQINAKTYSEEQFTKDGIGFGLAQWTYSTRKANLYKFATDSCTPIENLDMQLAFLVSEIKNYYKTVDEAIRNTTNLRECSDIIVKRYEKPKNQTEKFLQNRAIQGSGYLVDYADKKKSETKTFVKVVVATDDVNLRVGNGKQYGRVGVLKKGLTLPYVTEVDGWYAAEYFGGTHQVVWVSKEFSKVEEKEG